MLNVKASPSLIRQTATGLPEIQKQALAKLALHFTKPALIWICHGAMIFRLLSSLGTPPTELQQITEPNSGSMGTSMEKSVIFLYQILQHKGREEVFREHTLACSLPKLLLTSLLSIIVEVLPC